MVIIKFPGVTDDEANQFAGNLSAELSEDIVGVEATPARTRRDTQDFGATLVLLLGTASATAVATGIKNWLTRKGTKADFYSRDGKHVLLENVQSKDIREIAKALS